MNNVLYKTKASDEFFEQFNKTTRQLIIGALDNFQRNPFISYYHIAYAVDITLNSCSYQQNSTQEFV